MTEFDLNNIPSYVKECVDNVEEALASGDFLIIGFTMEELRACLNAAEYGYDMPIEEIDYLRQKYLEPYFDEED